MKSLTIVIPVYNEEKNIVYLYKEIIDIVKNIGYKSEFIFVDDGSTDLSKETIAKLQKTDERVNLVEFTKNFGQTAALDAGIKLAKGDVIVTLDADCQNDPKDISLLLAKLEQSFDVVCGWRQKRQDSIEKRLFSFMANRLRKWLTKETIHDSGCSLRVYKREVFQDIDLYGEMHRFIPAILSLKGYRIAEIPVNHRLRKHGKSKYGMFRLVKGLMDLLFIVFLLRFAAKPIHVFGIIGIATFLAGFLLASYLTLIKILYGVMLSNRPLLILSVLLMVLGAQFFVFGIMAEFLIRIYFKSHSATPYTVRKLVK